MSRSERRPNLWFAMPLITQFKPHGAQVQVLYAVLIRNDSKFSPLNLFFDSAAIFQPHVAAGIRECSNRWLYRMRCLDAAMGSGGTYFLLEFLIQHLIGKNQN